MSLCDRCYMPGACCRHLIFSRPGRGSETFWLDGSEDLQLASIIGPHPFKVAEVLSRDSGLDGIEYGSVRWSCRNLTDSGRCGDYDNRPALCRDFEAGSDALCVHWRGAEGGEGTMVP